MKLWVLRLRFLRETVAKYKYTNKYMAVATVAPAEVEQRGPVDMRIWSETEEVYKYRLSMNKRWKNNLGNLIGWRLNAALIIYQIIWDLSDEMDRFVVAEFDVFKGNRLALNMKVVIEMTFVSSVS